MSSYHHLKAYCYEHAQDFGLSTSSINDVTISAYSRGAEPYQSQAILVGDRESYCQIFKRSRDTNAQRCLINQATKLERLLRLPDHNSLRRRLILGTPCQVSGEFYLRFPYQSSRTLYQRIRSGLTGRNDLEAIRIAISFCLELEQSGKRELDVLQYIHAIQEDYHDAYPSADTSEFSKITQTICRGYDTPVTTVIHNDLGASNILQSRQEAWLIDFEYWQFNLSIFNFFDALINFGSLFTTPAYQRRSHKSYCAVFSQSQNSRLKRFMHELSLYAQHASYINIKPEAAYSIYCLFLMNKACCQHRTYRASYQFDHFWKGHLDWVLDHPTAFKAFWKSLLEQPPRTSIAA